MSASFFDDEEFQNHLVALITRDPKTLRTCGNLLDPNDFKPLPGQKHGRQRWIVAERALQHYQSYHEPIGKLLKSDLTDYATELNLNDTQVQDLLDFSLFITKIKTAAPDAIVDKVVKFKREKIRAATLQEMVELQNSGQLDDGKWIELCRKAVSSFNGAVKTIDYFESMEARIKRRKSAGNGANIPWTMIDPLDSLIRCIGPKQVGLIFAPYKRGKSLMLIWLALACILQRYEVLYITLEDSRETVEDRMDASLCHIPIKALNEYPKQLAERFGRFRNMVHKKLHVYDGTEGGITVNKIEQVLLHLREEGHFPEVTIIDYDNKIVPRHRMKDQRRLEFAEIYGDLANFAAKNNQILWTAAQTQRDTRGLRIISGDRIAEDISKLQQVVCALSLGKSDWSDDAIYIYVAAHKNDQMGIGCDIIPDLKRMTIYDRDQTLKAYKQNGVSMGVQP